MKLGSAESCRKNKFSTQLKLRMKLDMKLGSCRVLAQKPVSYPVETLCWALVLSRKSGKHGVSVPYSPNFTDNCIISCLLFTKNEIALKS
jgi:hypothetical protein